ncbi:unnamed protein product [Mycena citricolor]|uniref:Uncharacterized protein n=1 Tax=Mycena citricolor TaxID=2018698 RepID=A0AAD2I0G2_9AGAR|nr:unnamed protein product [Mycena citricolor]
MDRSLGCSARRLSSGETCFRGSLPISPLEPIASPSNTHLTAWSCCPYRPRHTTVVFIGHLDLVIRQVVTVYRPPLITLVPGIVPILQPPLDSNQEFDYIFDSAMD